MVFGILKLVGVLLFSYLVWRKLKDDYREDLLIAYSWWALLSILVGGRVVFGLVNWGVWNENPWDWFWLWQKPGFNYLGSLVGCLAVTIWYCRKNEWKVWSFLEGITSVVYLLLIFLMVEELVKTNFSLRVGGYLAVAVVGYTLSRWLVNKYRSFVWYVSGKKGFVFFFVNAVSAMLLAVFSWFMGDGITVTATYMVISLISFGGLFILGEVFSNLIKRR